MIRLRLNPTLDTASYARQYGETRCVQIPNLFEDEIADSLERVLMGLPWQLICQNEFRENVLLSQEQLRLMSPGARKELEDGIRQRAAENFGFTYFTYPMIEAAQAGRDPQHPIHALTAFLNSQEFISFAGAIINHPGITKIDAHATNYVRGHFLTRHIDDGRRRERRAAYTIGFSRGWQTDWGGLLMFLNDDGDAFRALKPRFNVLTVFDGLMLHSVSAISTFAPKSRLSVAGWFRDDPISR